MNQSRTSDTDELLRAAHLRLLPADSITSEIADAMRHVRPVADGLVRAYALDRATDVRILTDRDVERVGSEELEQAASQNLMRVPVTHEAIPHQGTVLHSLYGDSHFVGSQALFLSAAVKRVTGESLPYAGALVVMPSRHNLVYHPLADGTVVDAVNGLASYAMGAFEDGPGALSPRLYWWHRGTLTSLTVIDDDSRSFSVQPPEHLLDLMRGLVRLDRDGRLATRAAAEATAADLAELTGAAAESVAGLSQDLAGLGDAFGSAVALALANCATDPKAGYIDTWNAWATAAQLGCALFTGGQSQECYLGEDLVRELPATPAAPPADARAWLDAVYLAIVCRDRARVSRLCGVPLEVLRQDDSVDAYVLHWVDTLQTFLSREGSMKEVVGKLTAAMETSWPGKVTRAPMEFMNGIDYQSIALFHRCIAGEHDAFDKTLAEALTEHGAYWGGSAAPRAQVALGPLAMAVLAFDARFHFDTARPYLPLFLVDGERCEEMPRA